jgi:methyl-accepting chemotaxis protein
MRRLGFSRLLLLLVAIPVLGLALLAGRLSYESWARYTALARAHSLLDLAVASGRLGLMGLPGEGGVSRDFLVDSNKAKLDQARANVDKLYRNVKEAAAKNAVEDAAISASLKGMDERFQNQLPTFRRRVDDKTAQVAEVTAVLQPITGFNFDLISRAGAVAGDAELSRRIFALYSALQFADGTFIQRGLIQISLQQGQLASTPFLMFGKGMTLQASFKKMFNDLAPAAAVAKYNAFAATYGKPLEEIQAFVSTNAGKPADAAMVQRWNEINRVFSALVTEIGSDIATKIEDDARELTESMRNTTILYMSLAGLMLVVVLLLSRSVVRILRDLLGGISHTMDELREGHYDVAVPSTERKDEIGAMARATESFRDSLVRMRAMEAEQREAEIRTAADRKATEEREAAAQKAAEAKAAADRKAAMQQLAGEFESAVGHIIQTVSSASTELEAAAGTLSETATVTQSLSGSVAAASEQASANVQSVASATEELSSSVTEISRQVHESSKIAVEAVKQAQKTDSRISELSQAAGRIGDVVKLITAIAEQTNLLALNATIEAARAGEAGKGFAVVAQEVKALASQTAKATDEIGTQIAGMQAATQESVGAIKEIGATIARISEIAGSVAAAVEEQGAATQEISTSVQQAARGTTQVASNISDVNRGAGETGAASNQVLSSARSLAKESAMLEREVAKFLDTVRAA